MNIAIIPARGGSKRIPRKNIRLFAGQPMIAYAIKAAQQSSLFEHIIVSTDDEEIAEISRNYGAQIPFIRPDELANDHVATVPVIQHAITTLAKQGLKPKNICCIYPSVPLLRPKDLIMAHQLLIDKDALYTLPVTTFSSAVQRALIMHTDGSMSSMYPKYILTRSQDLPDAYHDAGQFYWGTFDAWLQGNSPHQSGYGLTLPRWLVQDIDTEEDWQAAEYIYQAIQLMNTKGRNNGL